MAESLLTNRLIIGLMHLLVLVLQDVINVLGTFDVKLPTIQLYILYMTLLYSEHTHACTPMQCTHTHTHICEVEGLMCP